MHHTGNLTRSKYNSNNQEVFELDFALTSHVGQSQKLENLQRIIALGSRVDVDDIGDTFSPRKYGDKNMLD